MSYCPYCGRVCRGETCRSCSDLPALEAALLSGLRTETDTKAVRKARKKARPQSRRRPHPAPGFLATCPHCSTQSSGIYCPDCGVALYPPSAFRREAVSPAREQGS